MTADSLTGTVFPVPSCLEDLRTGAVVGGIAAGERASMVPVEWNGPDVINCTDRPVDDASTGARPYDARITSWSEIARRVEEAPDGQLQRGGDR